MATDTFRRAEESAQALEAVAAGDAARIACVYDEYAPLVLGVALRLVGDRSAAEDVVQETFVAVWTNAGRFDRQRGSASAWIMSIAHRRAIDALRRQRHRDALPLDHGEDPPGAPVTGDVVAEVVARLDGERVRTALGTLSRSQRQCIELAYYRGLTQQEIATAIGAPLGTVKSRVRLALQRLNVALAEPDDRMPATIAVPALGPNLVGTPAGGPSAA